MAAGLITMGIGNYWMSQLTLDISPWQVVWPRVVVIAGLSMIFAPLNVAAFLYIPKELRGAAVGLLALLRNEGGSVGTSIAQTIHERRDQFHSLRLGENLDPLNPAVKSFLEQAQSDLSPAHRRSRSPPSRWRCNRSKTCASNNPPRSPISTASLSSPWLRSRSPFSCS